MANKAKQGRIVIYHFPTHIANYNKETEQYNFIQTGVQGNNGQLTAPAIIATAWSDECVNLRVFADNENTYWKTSVMLSDGNGDWDKVNGYWSWPVIE